MTKNTNNSLSDINNEGGLGFNRLLSDNEINVLNTNPKRDLDKLISEKQLLEKQQKETEFGDSDYTALENKIQDLQIQINIDIDTKTDNFKKDGYPTSLFDRNAYIDYGRGIDNGKWEEYKKDKKDDKNSSFITNNTKSINEPVEYNDTSLSTDEGLSLQNLIKWSEKYPALQLRGQDFSYCKLLGYYPNNRLIILRRFHGGVPDNLFDYFETGSKIEFTQPLATMVTWLKPDDDIITMNFNEVWSESDGLGILETIKSKFSSITGTTEAKQDPKQELFSDILSAFALDKMVEKKEDGTDFKNSTFGNPNLIKDAKMRKTGGGGLSSTIAFTLTFEYELRYIPNIDPSIAMMDLISNAMRMGTSESQFMYNIPAFTGNVYVQSFMQGDISKATDMFVKGITKFTKNLSEVVDEGLKTGKKAMKNASKEVKEKGVVGAVTGALLGATIDSAKFILSRYREDLKAAISRDTGMPNGTWHVTIGNPKAPIVSCGDLIISKSELTLGKELGYNDFPNSFTVQYTLGLSRSRGRQELAKILNSGRGRLYVYPNAKDNPDFNIY